MTEKIMSFGYIERYQGREPGQMGLNKFLPCYGVKIVSDRENKRNEKRASSDTESAEVES